MAIFAKTPAPDPCAPRGYPLRYAIRGFKFRLARWQPSGKAAGAGGAAKKLKHRPSQFPTGRKLRSRNRSRRDSMSGLGHSLGRPRSHPRRAKCPTRRNSGGRCAYRKRRYAPPSLLAPLDVFDRRSCPNRSRSAGFQPAPGPPTLRCYVQIRTLPSKTRFRPHSRIAAYSICRRKWSSLVSGIKGSGGFAFRPALSKLAEVSGGFAPCFAERLCLSGRNLRNTIVFRRVKAKPSPGGKQVV
jgi:hypothetical protein